VILLLVVALMTTPVNMDVAVVTILTIVRETTEGCDYFA